jgi:hypothetical protein
MGHHLRFLVTDAEPVDLTDLGAALRTAGRAYKSQFDESSGTVSRSGALFATFEVSTPEDGQFEETLGVLEEAAADGSGRGEAKVADALATAQAIVTVHVLEATSGSDPALAVLEPVWEWLFTNHDGLMQSDGEGYFDRRGLIFEIA